MKITEMDSHCGNCELIDYCGEPYEEPYLCCDRRFENIEVKKYLELAETSLYGTKKDIADDVLRRITETEV